MTLIKIPSDFRDRWFSKSFGSEIEKRFANAGSSVEIDFSSCQWVDPLPVMALICHLDKWAASHESASGLELRIDLGSASTRTEGIRKARARLFLAAHGFLRAMFVICPDAVVRYDSGRDQYPVEFKAEPREQLEDAIATSAGCTLLYGSDPVCLPLIFISGKSPGDIANFVDRVVKMMDAKLFSGRQSEFIYRDSALVRVRQVATEIILNASEHAYPEEVPGPICLYARVRQHGDHCRGQDTETRDDSPLIDYIQNCTPGRYVELFICDIGYGLCHHARDWMEVAPDEPTKAQVTSALSDTKERLQRLLSLAFQRPVSRHKRSKVSGQQTRSNVTGLSHVNTVLSSHGDVSRILVAPTWIASKHPRAPDDHGGESKGILSTVESIGVPTNGTFFLFAIPISSSNLESSLDGWLHPPKGAQEVSGYWPADVFRDDSAVSNTGLAVFDLPGHLERSSKASDQARKTVGDAFDSYLNAAGEIAVVRMSRDFRKNLTDELVGRWLKRYSSERTATPLAFCDLSRAQAILLAEHLGNLKPYPDDHEEAIDVRNPPGILVLSEDLIARMCFLNRDQQNRYRFDRQVQPAASLALQVIRSLRHLDSREFWRRVEEMKAPLLLRNVRWSGDGDATRELTLPTYLDYSLAVQNRELAKIVRRALRRVLSTFPGHGAIPIDDLIRPDFTDASRWMTRPLVGTDVPDLFVISSVVTGSTVEREARYRNDPAAVIACFLVDANPPQPKDESCFRYYSALEWLPPKPSTSQVSDLLWEREPGTPFVRPFVRKGTDDTKRLPYVKPLARKIDDRSSDAPDAPSAAESYNEWHRDKLLKVGHWSIDRRHGLIEVNHLNALQIFADSAKGYYEWLAHELDQRSLGLPNPILVYPPGRLNSIMVRHLRKLRNVEGNLRLRATWQVVPINFLPDIGDGLKRLTSLTEEHIRDSKDVIGSTVFFLDIGYVGNRTFRHTRRQLLDLGVGRVLGFGLLNRTSSPALTSETKNPEVNCYWRMDVPSLDDQRSCPICGGLKAMEALLERTRRFQSGTSDYVKRVFDNWRLSDPGKTWEEHGLSSLELKTPLKKKYGFKPPETPSPPAPVIEPSGQNSLLTASGEVIPPPPAPVRWWPSNEVTWSHVWLRDSAQAVAYAIEIARTQAAPLYPLRLASQLAPPEDVTEPDFISLSTAVEIIACYLLLCAHELSVATKEAAGVQLIGYLARMEGADVSGRYAELKVRFARLRELVALALINLDNDTKRLLLREVILVISRRRLIHTETCVAFMAVIMDKEDLGSAPRGQISLFDKLVTNRLREPEFSGTDNANTLQLNYWLLTLDEPTLPQQFDEAMRFFGARQWHGDCISILNDVECDANALAGWGVCRHAIRKARTLICSGNQHKNDDADSIVESGELFKALCKLDPVTVSEIVSLSQLEATTQFQEDVNRARKLIDSVRTPFQGSMIRFEPTIENNEGFTCLKTMLEEHVSSACAESAPDQFKICMVTTRFRLAAGDRYLLVGEELRLLFAQLAKEAFANAPEDAKESPKDIEDADATQKARLWIVISGDESGKVAVEFLNQGKQSCDRPDDFEVRAEDMAPVHSLLGGDVSRRAPTGNENRWYCTRIMFAWFQGGRS